MSFKSGFVALIGLPNTGKSTLLNQIFNKKIAIVSDKPQTTRNAIRGILNDENYQIVFIDTPGIHDPQDEFGRFLNRESYSNIEGADLVYFLIDATKPMRKKQIEVLERIQQSYSDIPIFGIINKIDLINQPQLISLLDYLNESFKFDELIPISALENDNITTLLELTLQQLEEGPAFFSEEDEVDYTLSFQISEIIREKILYMMKQELPHQIGVVVESIEQEKDDMTIYAKIIVSSASQKPILIGKQGSMIKKIRVMATKELRNLLNRKIDLELFVSVEPDWRNKSHHLKELGYNHE